MLHRQLGELDHARPADARLVEVAHEVRLGIAGDRHDGRVLLRHVPLLLEEPRRGPGQRLVRAELDHRLADVHVAIDPVHVAGAGLVRRPRDRSDERRVLDEPGDDDELSFLDVRADTYGKLGIPLEPGLLVYVNCHSSSWMIGISSPSAVTPDDLHFGAADHEVGVHDGDS